MPVLAAGPSAHHDPIGRRPRDRSAGTRHHAHRQAAHACSMHATGDDGNASRGRRSQSEPGTVGARRRAPRGHPPRAPARTEPVPGSQETQAGPPVTAAGRDRGRERRDAVRRPASEVVPRGLTPRPRETRTRRFACREASGWRTTNAPGSGRWIPRCGSPSSSARSSRSGTRRTSSRVRSPSARAPPSGSSTTARRRRTPSRTSVTPSRAPSRTSTPAIAR